MLTNAAQIFLRTTAGKLQPLTEQGYETEGYLQALLADHPELLAGDQIDDETPRRWLLVGQEVGIPDAHGASDRWSIDHIFVDQDAMPTFVEVKRSSDARIRREVVGQLIEYAANAARYWPVGFLQERAAREARERGRELGDLLRELLQDDGEPTDFWERAESKLRRGELRLIFVADKIPPELRRMAEFMNDQMTDTEVLAIEVRQYVGNGQSVMVPYVLNVNERAKKTKTPAGSKRGPALTREALMSAISQARPGAEQIAEKLLSKFEALGCSLETRASGISVRFDDPRNSRHQFTVCVISKTGTCDIGWLIRPEQRGLGTAIKDRYIHALREIGFKISEGADYSSPYSLVDLQHNLDKFIAAAQTYVDELREATQPA